MRIHAPIARGIAISDRVRHAIAEETRARKADLRRPTHLADDLGLDSLDVVQVRWAVEEEFGIQIPEADVEALTTVGAWEDYIAARMREVT